jgi:hypothetical protein
MDMYKQGSVMPSLLKGIIIQNGQFVAGGRTNAVNATNSRSSNDYYREITVGMINIHKKINKIQV